jgi:hypothetical protein
MKDVYFIFTAAEGHILSLFDPETRQQIPIGHHPKLRNIPCPLGVGVWREYPNKPGYFIVDELMLDKEPYSDVIDVFGEYPYRTNNNMNPDYPERVVATLNEIWITGLSCANALGMFSEPTSYGSMTFDTTPFYE